MVKSRDPDFSEKQSPFFSGFSFEGVTAPQASAPAEEPVVIPPVQDSPHIQDVSPQVETGHLNAPANTVEQTPEGPKIDVNALTATIAALQTKLSEVISTAAARGQPVPTMQGIGALSANISGATPPSELASVSADLVAAESSISAAQATQFQQTAGDAIGALVGGAMVLGGAAAGTAALASGDSKEEKTVAADEPAKSHNVVDDGMKIFTDFLKKTESSVVAFAQELKASGAIGSYDRQGDMVLASAARHEEGSHPKQTPRGEVVADKASGQAV